MKINLQDMVDLLQKGIEEHFIADEVTLAKTAYYQENNKLTLCYYERETDFTYKVIIYLKDNENAKYIETSLLRVENIYALDELMSKGYIKYKALLDTFRKCWFFDVELEEIL